MKLAPVRVTGTPAPWAPLFGLTELRVGAEEVTVKVADPLVPAEVVTVTFVAPTVALAAIVNVAVIWVELTTLTLLTVTPALATLTEAPAMKLAPVRVTGTLAPWAPLFGLTELRVGAEEVTVKVADPLVPAEVVTVTFVAPTVALAAIVNVAVIWVELTTLTLLTVTPALATLTEAPATKLAPVRVTGTPAPWAPLFGLTEARVGAEEVTVKVAAPLVPAEVVTVTFVAPTVALLAIVNVAVI